MVNDVIFTSLSIFTIALCVLLIVNRVAFTSLSMFTIALCVLLIVNRVVFTSLSMFTIVLMCSSHSLIFSFSSSVVM